MRVGRPAQRHLSIDEPVLARNLAQQSLGPLVQDTSEELLGETQQKSPCQNLFLGVERGQSWYEAALDRNQSQDRHERPEGNLQPGKGDRHVIRCRGTMELADGD